MAYHYSLKKEPAIFLLLIFSFIPVFFFSCLFAQEPAQEKNGGLFKKKPARKVVTEDLGEFQRQAREYRSLGLSLQQSGDLQKALSFYQKAAELDPNYPVVANDLGILYESIGDLDRAEESYLRACNLDPKYLSAYSNLALLYENKRDLKKAALCWRKRAELGDPQDPWTQKAFRRLEDIQLTLGEKTVDSKREQEVFDLIQDVSDQKFVLKDDDKSSAWQRLQRAKTLLDRGQDLLALREAVSAKQLDPSSREIDDFIEKVQKKLLSK